MKYDIGDINRLCKEHPLNSVWQIIDMGTGKVFTLFVDSRTRSR